jgi:hypothetical protein
MDISPSSSPHSSNSPKHDNHDNIATTNSTLNSKRISSSNSMVSTQHSIDAKESAGGGNKQPGLPLLKPLFTSSSSSASTGHRSNHEHHQHSM